MTMTVRSKALLHGTLEIFLRDAKTGVLMDYRKKENTIVDAGEIWVAELLADEHHDGTEPLGSPISEGLEVIAVGESGVSVTQDDVELGNGLDDKAIDTRDVANNVITVATTFGTGEANGALQEAGIFAALCGYPAGGTAPSSETDKTNRMFNRTTFATINKSSSFTLTLQWTITIGSLT